MDVGKESDVGDDQERVSIPLRDLVRFGLLFARAVQARSGSLNLVRTRSPGSLAGLTKNRPFLAHKRA